MPTIKYVWDFFEENITEEFDDSGNLVTEYFTEPSSHRRIHGQNVIVGSVTNFAFDPTGSTVATTTSSGDVDGTASYDSFGELVYATGMSNYPFKFAGALGYYTDASSLSLYYAARVYSPRNSRWLSLSPVTDQIVESTRYVAFRNNPSALMSALFKAIRQGAQALIPPKGYAGSSRTLSCHRDCCPPQGICRFRAYLTATPDAFGNLSAGAEIGLLMSPGNFDLPFTGPPTVADLRHCKSDLNRSNRLGYILIRLTTGETCRFTSQVFPENSFNPDAIDWNLVGPPACKGIIDASVQPGVIGNGGVVFTTNVAVSDIVVHFDIIIACGCNIGGIASSPSVRPDAVPGQMETGTFITSNQGVLTLEGSLR